MSEQTAEVLAPQEAAGAAPDYEVVVIGAGVAGIYQIKRLKDLGVRATVLKANPDLGGTWYHNRYPGARF
ncbi:MAG: NAD(P)-binding protein, partial [Gammaproteobacteria bacterium]|nr:NAD(P)-binding protein [Gammaproteobacteria bacterium]